MHAPLFQLKTYFREANLAGLQTLLANYPEFANEGIPFDDNNPAKAHPLHRICDSVFEKKYTEAQALALAQLFLAAGAHVNGFGLQEKQDTPLIAAASLHVDALALLYLQNGAEIHHPGTHGGTALHWAAWCSRAKVVQQLIEMQADVHKKCIDFQSTPLFWAVHGLKNSENPDRLQYAACIQLLIEAGADKNVPNAEGTTIFELLNDADATLKALLHS
ncbi:MAG: ankyrin repeat domain-containing protein [Saprospiraceae bacterium]